MTKKFKQGAVAVAIIALLLLAAQVVFGSTGQEAPKEVSLTKIIQHIDAGDVTVATLDDGSSTITVELDDGTSLTSAFPISYGRELTTKLMEVRADTDIIAIPPPSFLSNLRPLLGPLLMIAFLFWIIRSGLLTGGKGKGSKQSEIPETRFTDVAGAEEAVQEMKELVEFLKDGERFRKVGARPPKGALLVGPPGTGKTLLARAVAGEAGVPFFAAAGSDFVEKIVGTGASRVREMFKAAKASPNGAIIFIDEIDAAGRKRDSSGGDSVSFEIGSTLTALLTEMDGFDQNDIIVIGATNLPDVLDPALLRRLERVIQVPLPDRGGRTQILEIHAKGRPFEDGIDWVAVGRGAFGMSGADLEKVINEACMEAARSGDSVVTETHLHSALSTVEMGRARTSALVTPEDRDVTAWHEAGHALVALLADQIEDPTYVTIIPRGGSGGHTRSGGTDHMFISVEQAKSRLAMMMGGRAAEMIALDGNFTQGASSDLQAATALATAMVTDFGMGTALVHVSPEARNGGGVITQSVNGEVQVMLESALAQAYDLVTDNRDLLSAIRDNLLERETLSREDLITLVRDHHCEKSTQKAL